MKTAVNWLNEQIEQKLGLDEEDVKLMKWLIDKAIILEQKQILDAVFYGCVSDENDIPSNYYKNNYEQC